MSTANVEPVFLSRLEEKLGDTAPGFDPLIVTTLLDLLMGLVTSCFGPKPTPEEAIAKVKKMTVFQQSALRSRLVTQARARGVKDAKAVAYKAADALQSVAMSSTPEEQLAFARYLAPMASEEFDLF